MAGFRISVKDQEMFTHSDDLYELKLPDF